MICKSCGGENNNGEKYCKYCHTILVDNQSSNILEQPTNNNLNNIKTSFINSLKKEKKGIIIIFVFPILVTVGFYLLFLFLSGINDNKVIKGDWYCSRDIDNIEVNKSNAVVHLKFTKDNFVWAKNNNESDYFFEGTFKFVHDEDDKYRLNLFPKKGKRDGNDSKEDIFDHHYSVIKNGDKMNLSNIDVAGRWKCVKG